MAYGSLAALALMAGTVAPLSQQDAPSLAPGLVETVAMEAPQPVRLAQAEDAWFLCSGCHSVIADEPSFIGPNLHGVFGREAGALDDFDYSETMAQSGIVWTEDNLRAFISDPAAFMPNNNMPFDGISDPAEVDALVDYLKSLAE